MPFVVCRLVGLGALVALSLGIWLSLEVGAFPWIVLVSLVPLVPVAVLDAVVARRGTRPGAGITVLIDEACAFCRFACRLVVAVAGIPGAVVRDARTDPVAAVHLAERSAWSVVVLGGRSPETAHGWEALRLVLARSPRAWLLRWVPGPALGSRVYAWLAAHRGALGAIGGALVGRGGGRPGLPGAVVAGASLAVVLGWNGALYGTLQGWGDYRAWVRPWVATLGLMQYWSMFSPHPPLRDVWHLVPALRHDGEVVELLSGGEVALEPPVDGPRRYGGHGRRRRGRRVWVSRRRWSRAPSRTA